jgi:hypothetical protein
LKTFLSIFWLIFVISILDIQGEPLSSQPGTIIVSYQMSETHQCLDRIRFWLINPQQERTLYPKKDEFISNSHTPNERTVVIPNLPAGHYQIEFLVPNSDQRFEETPIRDINLHPGAVVKIEQIIRINLY